MAWTQYPDSPMYMDYHESVVDARRSAILYLSKRKDTAPVAIFKTSTSKKPMGMVSKIDGKFYWGYTIESYGRTMYGSKLLNKDGTIVRGY